jgi:heme/copper-type cytochrome/quinol oxidase subunit 2
MKKLYLDIGENYALSFQSEASPISIGIVDLHNKIMYVLIIIFIIVSYLLLKIINSKYNYLNRIKFFNHNQTRILEFI